MTDFPILAISFILNLIAVLFVICCIVLILMILIQKGKGGGLSSAFGGGMASGILGSKTGDFLTWVTIVLVGIMLLFAVILAKYYKPTPTNPIGVTTQQAPVTTTQGSSTGTSSSGQTNTSSGEESGSPVTMMKEIDMAEPETSAGNTTAPENNTIETSDSNQTGN